MNAAYVATMSVSEFISKNPEVDAVVGGGGGGVHPLPHVSTSAPYIGAVLPTILSF